MAGESHTIKTVVCGYHVYKEIRCAAVGEELFCIKKVENYRYLFAVAVVRYGVIRRSCPKKGMFDGLFFIDQNSQISVLITHFTSALADSMDDDGTVVDRGPHGSGAGWVKTARRDA